MIKTIGLLTAAMLVITGSLHAQSVQDGQVGVTRDAALGQAVRQLERRARVRVSAGATVTEGEVTGYSDDRVTVETRNGSSMPIPIKTIDEMWTRRDYTGRGAAIGGGIGAAVLGAYGFAAATGMCEQATGCGGAGVAVGLLGAAIGGAGGIVVGGAVGILTRRWVRIDPQQTRGY